MSYTNLKVADKLLLGQCKIYPDYFVNRLQSRTKISHFGELYQMNATALSKMVFISMNKMVRSIFGAIFSLFGLNYFLSCLPPFVTPLQAERNSFYSADVVFRSL